MNFRERDFLISRVTAGYLRYRHNDSQYFIHMPNADLEYAAKEIYLIEYGKAKESGVFTDEDVYNLLVKDNVWNEENEKMLKEELPRHIEIFQKSMYEAYSNYRSKTLEKQRKYLQRAREEILKLSAVRHKYDAYTCNAHAAAASLTYCIYHSLTDMFKKPCQWEDIELTKAVEYYNNNSLAPQTIRSLSNSSPWITIWSCAKSNGQVFNRYGAELTSEQRMLIMWSRMYDNINESPDSPGQEVIEDDDLLDGWMMIQRERRKQEDSESDEDGISDSIGRHDEIYQIAETQEDASKIYSKNGPMAKSIVSQRLKLVEEKGTVKHGAMPDIKQRAMMFANQAFSENMKGK